MARDKRIDAYIAGAAPFARPILIHLRALLHETVADLEETLKWGMPHFVHRGRNLAGMAAFKAHAAFILHGEGRVGEGMGGYGKIASAADLPADADLRRAILAARDRIQQGPAKSGPRSAAGKPEIAMPDDFAAALAEGDGLRARFDAFPPGARRDYLEWIVTAKAPATRARRIAEACGWIAEGKKRNWKYEAKRAK